jgi:hypothetical protein
MIIKLKKLEARAQGGCRTSKKKGSKYVGGGDRDLFEGSIAAFV